MFGLVKWVSWHSVQELELSVSVSVTIHGIGNKHRKILAPSVLHGLTWNIADVIKRFAAHIICHQIWNAGGKELSQYPHVKYLSMFTDTISSHSTSLDDRSVSWQCCETAVFCRDHNCPCSLEIPLLMWHSE